MLPMVAKKDRGSNRGTYRSEMKTSNPKIRVVKNGARIEPMFLRVSTAAVVLNMAIPSVYELIREKILPAVKIGGKTRIPVAALRKFEQEALAQSEPVAAQAEP